MAATDGPLGYQFDPEDYELIGVLNHKLQNKPIPFDQVTHLDLYSNYPWVLLTNIQPAIKRTKRVRHLHPALSRNRKYPNYSNFECRCDENGNAVGKVTRFVFFQGDVDVGNVRKTDWSMVEFTNMNDDDDEFVICKLSDQPVRDFDDDEDDDSDDDSDEDDDSDDVNEDDDSD